MEGQSSEGEHKDNEPVEGTEGNTKVHASMCKHINVCNACFVSQSQAFSINAIFTGPIKIALI